MVKLAIISNSFSKDSQTFVLEAVRSIAPESTVLLSRDYSDPTHLSCPALLGFGDSYLENNSVLGKLSDSLRFRWNHYLRVGLSPASARHVAAFLLCYRPKVILAEFGPNGCLIQEVADHLGIPFYVHFHGSDANSMARSWVLRRKYTRIFRRAAGIIVPSRFLGTRLVDLGCQPENIFVIPNGVDVKRFTPGKKDPLKVVAVSRLSEEKGPIETIRAFAIVAEAFPKAHLEFCGSGPLYARCQKEIEQLQLTGQVRLLGQKSSEEVAKILSSATVFVQHSKRTDEGEEESFGVSIVEAALSGVPVVATRSGGVPDTVVDGVTGVLVDEHHVEAMGRSIIHLLSDPDRVNQMGKAARRRAQKDFSSDAFGDRMRTVLGIAPTKLSKAKESLLF